MLLSPLNIGHFLLDQQQIRSEQMVDGLFTIHDLSSRNQNFVINKYQENALFVKQVRSFDAEKTETLKREATCYWLAKHHKGFESWKSIMPTYTLYDEHNHILVTPFYRATALDSLIRELKYFPSPSLAEQMADLLIECHNQECIDLLKEEYSKYFPGEKPFVFKMATDLFKSTWRENEAFRKKLFDLITLDPDHLERMRQISNSWSAECVIHSDIKFQNLLVNEQQKIRLIDWETCDLGDPSWDLAAVFHMYLVAWMNSELLSAESKPKEKPKMLALPKQTVQWHLKSFWERYALRSNWSVDQNQSHFRKCIQYTSLKMLHTAFEITNQTKVVDAYVARLLQFGLNMLKDPNEIKDEFMQ